MAELEILLTTLPTTMQQFNTAVAVSGLLGFLFGMMVS